MTRQIIAVSVLCFGLIVSCSSGESSSSSPEPADVVEKQPSNQMEDEPEKIMLSFIDISQKMLYDNEKA